MGRENSEKRVRNSKDEDLQTNEPSDAEEGYIEEEISVVIFAGKISFVRRI